MLCLGSLRRGLPLPLALLVMSALGRTPVRGQEGARPAAAEDLAASIAAQLHDELTSHWYPHAVDRENGGFHQNLARDWSLRPDDSKFLVYQARMTWTAAAYAEFNPDQREEYLGHARHGLAFLDEVMRDREGGGFHWSLGPRGKIDPRIGDDKHVYGISFVIYAASKLRAVGGDARALKVAQDAFEWLEAHSHDARHGGYFEALKRDGTPITAWDPAAALDKRTDRLGIYYGFKTMNVHIHMLEALAELSRVDSRPIVKERLREVFHLVRDKVAVEPGALNLYLTRDWRAIPAHDSFGHDVETAYLLVEAAEALGMPDDERTWSVARSLVDHALDWGWDDEHGGFYDKGESFGNRAFDATKVWWTEAEGLNALLVMDRKYGRETDRYARAFRKQWDFIRGHLLDPKHGGWFYETERDGTLRGNGAKANPWKANYHTSRALMNVVRLLRSASPAHSQTSGAFAPLFNGRDLSGWYTFLQKHGKNHDPDRVVTIEDGAIHLYKHAAEGANVVMGYIATEKEYGNYHFRFQYRWGERKFQPRLALKRDAGFYYHILGPDAVWPRALQFQVEQTHVGDLIALHGFQLDTTSDPKTIHDEIPIYQPADQGGQPRVMGGKGIVYQRRLPGEFEVEGWNTAEVIAQGAATTHILNGRVVTRGRNIRLANPEKPGDSPDPVTRGRIALEIEAAEIFYRNVEIQELGKAANSKD